MDVTPTPSDEELAAIMVAYQAVARPVVVVTAETPSVSPAWRFSGRWWSRPIASRRIRPG